MLYIIFIISAFLVAPSVQQECVSYDRNDLISPCSAVDPTSWAYLLPGEKLEDKLKWTNLYIGGLKQLAYDPICTPQVVTWLCYNKDQSGSPPPLKNCAVDDFGQPVYPPVEVQPCKDMCQRFVDACLPLYELSGIGFLLYNYCDQFSNNDTIVGDQVIKCWNVTGVFDAPPPGNLTCPDYTAPFYYDGNRNRTDTRNRGQYGNKTNTCQARCPSPEYTDQQLLAVAVSQQTLAWISFVLATIIILFYSLNKDLRKFPSRIVLWLLISTLPLSLAFMLLTFSGGSTEEVWCGQTISFGIDTVKGSEEFNADIRAINNDWLCVFQGSLLVFGTLSVTAWWMILSVNTLMLVKVGRDVSTEFGNKYILREVIYHCIGWGLPLIMVIIVTAAHKVDYETTYLYCFISSSSYQDWRIACWFVWVGLFFVVGSIAMIWCLIIIIKSMRTIRNRELNQVKIIRLIRIIICLLFFFVLVSIIFSSQILNSATLKNNSSQITKYLICILGGTADSVCRDKLNQDTVLNDIYAMGLAASLCMASAGFILALIFGTNPIVFKICRENIEKLSSGSGQRTSETLGRNELSSSINDAAVTQYDGSSTY